MQRYHPMMLDIAEQLMLKWERLNVDEEIDVIHDMTALTLDTIGLCGFGYRFNSLYRRRQSPVRQRDGPAPRDRDERAGVSVRGRLDALQARKLEANVAYMNAMVDDIIAEREEQRARGDDTGHHDLLGDMLDGVDRKTGERLDDENIRYQIITFLIAGHETTSGMLSFAIYYTAGASGGARARVRGSGPRVRYRFGREADRQGRSTD